MSSGVYVKRSAIRGLEYIFLLLIGIPHPSQCSTPDTTDSSSHSELRPSLELDFIHASRLSCHMPVTSSTQISVGLDVTINRNGGSSDGNGIIFVGSDTSRSTIPETLNSFSGEGTITVLYLVDFLKESSLSFYGGAGPFATYARMYASDKVSYIGQTTTGHDSNNSTYSWTYGVAAAIGIHISLTANVGVHAEYDLSVGHQKLSSSNSYTSFDGSSSSTSAVDSKGSSSVSQLSGVVAGLSFQF